MDWTLLLKSITTASRTLVSARYLLVLFLIASAASYFITNGDPGKLLIATIATILLIFVIRILAVAASTSAPFVRLVAGISTSFAMIVFFLWILTLSGRALFAVPSCLPFLEDCGRPPPSPAVTLKLGCDLFTNPESEVPSGDSYMISQFLPVEASNVPEFLRKAGQLYIDQSNFFYFKNSAGELWKPDIHYDPDITAKGRYDQDGWETPLTHVFLYGQLSGVIRDELGLALNGYSDLRLRAVLGIDYEGKLVAIVFARALNNNGLPVFARQATALGQCVMI